MTTPARTAPTFDDVPLQIKLGRAAKQLDLNERTIRRLISQGELIAVGRGRLRRVEYSSLLAYIARHRNTA